MADKKSDIQLYNDLFEVVKNAIKDAIDEEYTTYKLKCLDNLEYSLEVKRNDVVKKILDSIDITMRKEATEMYPNIVIKINKGEV